MNRFTAMFLLALAPSLALPSAGPHTLPVDWEAALPGTLANPEQFAVDVPVAPALSIDPGSLWTLEGAYSVWRQDVIVPEAISVSFRANPVRLPAGGSEIVLTTNGKAYRHGPESIRDGQLWSRIGKGDRFTVEVRVPAGSEAQAQFSLNGVQAGFRTLDGTSYNAAYHRYVSGEGDYTGQCAVNFECRRDSSNTNHAQSAIAWVVANVVQCSATLLRDVSGSFAPYVAAALHCGAAGRSESGRTRDEDAQTMNFYWNATTPCGSALGTIYDAASQVSFGADDRAAFGDSWLLELQSAPPAGTDPFWAGFDATDDAVGAGTFGIHHGGGKAKQYLFSSYAVNKLDGGNGTDGHQWWVSVSEGDIVPGGSGSGLFDPAGRYVGSAFGGSAESCPYQPSLIASSAFYDRLGPFWDGGGTADTAARFWLDPNNTGARTSNGAYYPARANPSLTFTSDRPTAQIGLRAEFHWAAEMAGDCEAGGPSGHSWSGQVGFGPTNALVMMQGPAGDQVFTLTCAGERGSSVTRSITITVADPPAPVSSGDSGGAASVMTLFILLLLARFRRL